MCWSSYEKRLVQEEQARQRDEEEARRFELEAESEAREPARVEEPERELVRV